MMTLLEWILVAAGVLYVVAKTIEVAWKMKRATAKAIRVIANNAVVIFITKAAMFTYFALIVPVVGRVLAN